MKTKAILIATLLMSPELFAAAGQQQQGASSLSFAQIQQACQNPAKFHNQVAPTNINVSCRDQQTKWVPVDSGAVSMQNARQVYVTVMSDKYTSNMESKDLTAEVQMAACPKFKQTVETIETVRSVTCDELTSFQGTSIDFCADTVGSMRQQNPAAIVTQDTGKVFELCASSNGGVRKGGLK